MIYITYMILGMAAALVIFTALIGLTVILDRYYEWKNNKRPPTIAVSTTLSKDKDTDSEAKEKRK